MSYNPRTTPLHRYQQLRNADRARWHYPQLAAPLFTPTHLAQQQQQQQPTPRAGVAPPPISHAYHPYDGTDDGAASGGLRTAQPPHHAPQPTMTQFWQRATGDLAPLDFATPRDEAVYHARHAHPGFVAKVRGGENQLARMVHAGLDPRVAPPPEELRRRADLERRVQRCRDEIDMQVICDQSRGGVEGRKREETAPFPGWNTMVRRGMEEWEGRYDTEGAQHCQPGQEVKVQDRQDEDDGEDDDEDDLIGPEVHIIPYLDFP